MFLLGNLVGNPAISSFQDLFSDSDLKKQVKYLDLLVKIDARFVDHKPDVVNRPGLAALLREPIDAAPDSLSAQVAYIKQEWSRWLPDDFLHQIDVAQAIYHEETRSHLPGPGPVTMPVFGQDDHPAPAAFTKDTAWMSSAIMLAKSIYVWLDQLSYRYQSEISSLADIPEDELASLSKQGFNALWLIGIWERSLASRKIKQLCGNPEAEASAYALHAYRVASDLGGDAALATLEERCYRHGIRLACDVVPNHTGIDSEWVVHHPDWFIQTEHPPYPGNDGTHMPWNDTAQLNFLLPDVRRAMSDLIIATAKRFRLIRFDAAMTLARKHYRRLWFPPPGGSAGVPSRSQAWLTDEEFNKAFPVEFWREVVDRINMEAPDTLLIAEAFWLMESYFVRNLGMHRVYNSAFMNMLKQEDNAKYRKILKDILAYNPEILKRYVNFMNNPDEATAVEQFGKGDKYFGVATLLATLPGLPMFGHGQIEGYHEKYGMEYRRAYWGEQPDEGFIGHHEQQIFPLLRQRLVFSGIENFLLYDFSTDDGVNENVYAFSNGPSGQKALVVFNNSPQPTCGRIHWASPKAVNGQEGVSQDMPPLWQELELGSAQGHFCRFRNLHGYEYLSPLKDIQAGLRLQLEGYQHLVLSDFSSFDDDDGVWQRVFNRVQDTPVPSLGRERQKTLYEKAWTAFIKLMDLERLHVLAGVLSAPPVSETTDSLLTELAVDLDILIQKLELKPATAPDQEKLPRAEPFTALKRLPEWLQKMSATNMPQKLLPELWHGKRSSPGLGAAIIAWLVLSQLGKELLLTNDRECLTFIKKTGLDFAWQQQADTSEKNRLAFVALLLLNTSSAAPGTDDKVFAELCTDSSNSALLGVNHHAGTTWFNREGMIALAGTVALQAALKHLSEDSAAPDIEELAEKLRQRLARATAVGYRLDKFLVLG
jgi:glycosidase